MGISFSCPFAFYADLENGFEYAIRNSLSFCDKEVKGYEVKEIEPAVSVKAPNYKQNDDLNKKITQISNLDLMIPKHEAATKVQKVYKSFRTRRKLADCAVVIEQSWWKLLDFAELKRSSISFFDIEKHETAISRWSRARTRAAKVGKGLSKNNKAQKLALQHWLEAIDPRHRYGHNLHPYYNKWLQSQSLEPFFYWLDIGEGKEVNLVDESSRSKLQHQCIKYLGPMERLAYEVVIENGKFFYKQSGVLVDTSGESESVKWIFVLSTSMGLYVGQKKKGTFQHSSFLAGGATSSAGRLVVEQGILKAIWPHSGHYRPTAENFQDFISFLTRNYVDLTDVKMDPEAEEESVHPRSISSKEYQLYETQNFEHEEILSGLNIPSKTNSKFEPSQPTPLLEKSSKILIPNRNSFHENENQSPKTSERGLCDDDENNEEVISEESIMKRINSHKEMKSFQLGKQLSCKWTTGAGPRIGCVRDYPSKLQSHALEQLDLSPRSGGQFSSNSSRESTPRSFDSEFFKIRRCTHHSSPLCKELLTVEVTE